MQLENMNVDNLVSMMSTASNSTISNPYLLDSTLTPSDEIQLKLYDIFIPILGIGIIILNLAVVISSGLILQTGISLFLFFIYYV